MEVFVNADLLDAEANQDLAKEMASMAKDCGAVEHFELACPRKRCREKLFASVAARDVRDLRQRTSFHFKCPRCDHDIKYTYAPRKNIGKK